MNKKITMLLWTVQGLLPGYEFQLSYHFEEALLFTLYGNHGSLVTGMNNIPDGRVKRFALNMMPKS